MALRLRVVDPPYPADTAARSASAAAPAATRPAPSYRSAQPAAVPARSDLLASVGSSAGGSAAVVGSSAAPFPAASIHSSATVRCSLPPAYPLISRCALQLFPAASLRFAGNANHRRRTPKSHTPAKTHTTPRASIHKPVFQCLFRRAAPSRRLLKNAFDLLTPVARNVSAQADIRSPLLLRSQLSIKIIERVEPSKYINPRSLPGSVSS